MQKVILLMMFFMITTIIYSQNPCPGVTTVTYSSKIYKTVQIGTQCWLQQNLDVGTMIQGTQEAVNNSVIEKYCYDNNPNNCTTYGGLYQWNEAMAYSTTSAQGICPTGWHIPTYAELQTLGTAVGNNGNALKAIGQGTGIGAGTNTSNFAALLAGYGTWVNWFTYLGVSGYFWSSTEFFDGSDAYYLGLPNDNSVFFFHYPKPRGISIRCLKDASGTAVEGDNKNELPTEYTLSQNYPNPFNPTTKIKYELPENSFVTVIIFDAIGKEIETLINHNQEVGIYEIMFNGRDLPSGVYFYRIQAGDFIQTKKMILLK